MHPCQIIFQVSFFHPVTKKTYETKIFRTVQDIANNYGFFTKMTWSNIQNGRNTAYSDFVKIEKLEKDKHFKYVNNKFELIITK